MATNRIGGYHLLNRWAGLLAGVGLFFIALSSHTPPLQAATNDKLDLLVYPPVWTVSSQNSGSNLIAVRGKNGFKGRVTISVSGLPENIVDRYPTQSEFGEGKGGYYCSSHCQAASNADFPVPLTVSDGQWTSFAPTLLLGSASQSETKTVTISATGDGTTISQSITLKVVNDRYLPPDDFGNPPERADTTSPDVSVTIDNTEFAAHTYKINVRAGQQRTANVKVVNNQATAATVTLLSNLSSSGVSGITSAITGGFGQSTVSLAGNETKTIPFSFATSTNTINGTYEFMMGTEQTDGSNRATMGISTIVTSGVSGATPTPTASTTTPVATTTKPKTSSPTAAAKTTPAKVTPSQPTPPPTTPTVAPTVTQPTETPSSPTVPTTLATAPVIPTPEPKIETPPPPQRQQVRDQFVAVAQAATPPTAAAAVGVALVSLGAVAGPTAVAGVSSFGGLFGNILMMLGVLLNALLEALGLRRRRYPWGTVFDVGNDEPLELAIVRLKNDIGKLIETRVTDRAGRVGFLALPGKYVLEIIKPDFGLASKTLAAGSRFQPVYAGHILTIANDDATIQTNIPMKKATGHREHSFARFLRAWHLPLVGLSILLCSWNLLSNPHPLSYALLVFSLMILLAEWLLAAPKSFALVQTTNGEPLPNVTLQLLRTDDNKVVATAVTDQFGRYSFLARTGTYTLRVGSSAWQAPGWLTKRQFRITSSTGGLIATSFKVTHVSKTKKTPKTKKLKRAS